MAPVRKEQATLFQENAMHFRFGALLGFMASCSAAGPGADVAAVTGVGPEFVNFNENFLVGPRPISVVIVRHADPSDLERDYADLVGQAWLDGLRDHQAPWRLAVLPVAALPNELQLGALNKTEIGQRWADGTMADPDSVLEELLEPIPGQAGEYPIFETILAMESVGANDDFFLKQGLFVVHVVSMFEDESGQGSADELEDWLREDTRFGWAATEFSASTNLAGSVCVGGEADALLNMVVAVGGFQQDICDGTGPTRAAESYTASMTTYEMRLSARPFEFTIEVTSADYQGPEMQIGEHFDYDDRLRRVRLLEWQPKDLTSVWVRYVPNL